jgi:hypothetical protein
MISSRFRFSRQDSLFAFPSRPSPASHLSFSSGTVKPFRAHGLSNLAAAPAALPPFEYIPLPAHTIGLCPSAPSPKSSKSSKPAE